MGLGNTTYGGKEKGSILFIVIKKANGRSRIFGYRKVSDFVLIIHQLTHDLSRRILHENDGHI